MTKPEIDFEIEVISVTAASREVRGTWSMGESLIFVISKPTRWQKFKSWLRRLFCRLFGIEDGKEEKC